MPRHDVPGELEQDAVLAFRRVLSPGGAAQRLGVVRGAIYRAIGDGRLLAWVFPGRKKLSRLTTWLERGDREYGQGEVYVDFGANTGAAPLNWQAASTEWQGVTPAELLADAVEQFHQWRHDNPEAFLEEFGHRSYAGLLLDQERAS